MMWRNNELVAPGLTVLSLVVLLASQALGHSGDSLPLTPHEVQRFEQNGLAIELAITPLRPSSDDEHRLITGREAMVNVTLKDARTGEPVLGTRPRGWMNGRPSEMVATEATCVDKIRRLAAGRLSVRAEIDLNRYVVATLNHDKTISVIDPQLDFSATKLESLVSLPGVGADWVLSQDQSLLYVTIPDEALVAVVDTRTRRLIQTVPTGNGSRPGRILLQPDGRMVWVGLDGTAQVAVIEVQSNRLITTVPVGQGLHTLAAIPESRLMYVTNSRSDTVSVIDAETRSAVATVAVGKTPVALTYSRAAQRMYVGALNGAEIVVIDPTSHRVSARVPVSVGVVALSTEPQGRFVFAVNQMESRLFIMDAATNSVTAITTVVKDPDQIAFTEHYAYVRGIESEKFTLIELREARKGKLVPLDVQAGRQAPSVAPQELGVAPMIVATPEGNAVMIANAPDATLHYYQEGMMATMGTFSNYHRMPRGILVLDRSLRAVAPGTYQAPVTLPRAGRFDVPVLIDQPRTFHCFQVTVHESPDSTPTVASVRPPLVQPRFERDLIPALVPTALSFALVDPATQEPITGLRDVQVLVFEPPGSWQQRHWAREVESGRYVVTQSFPRVGEYRVMIQAPSRQLRFADSTSMVLTVVPPPSRQSGQVPSRSDR